MTMTEIRRLIEALRKEGWSADKILDLLLYIEGGEAEKNDDGKVVF